MNILFIHGNYPAQFRTLAEQLGAQGNHDVRYLTARTDTNNFPIRGVQTIQYGEKRLHKMAGPTSAQNITRETIGRGEIIQEKVIEMIQSGFTPKLIFFHPPRTPLLWRNTVHPTTGFGLYAQVGKCVVACKNKFSIDFLDHRVVFEAKFTVGIRFG